MKTTVAIAATLAGAFLICAPAHADDQVKNVSTTTSEPASVSFPEKPKAKAQAAVRHVGRVSGTVIRTPSGRLRR
jgi:hypothetical protein